MIANVTGDLLERLNSDDPRTAAYAAWTLGRMGAAVADTQEVISMLIMRTRAHEWIVSAAAIWALGRIRANSDEVISALVRSMRVVSHNDSVIACAAMTACGRLYRGMGDGAPARVVDLIVDLSENKEWIVRRYAAKSIGWIGIRGQRAVAALNSLTVDADVRVSAAAALARERVQVLPDVSACADHCSQLDDAVSRSHADCVRRLISGGADVNARDYTGYTPLHWAALRKNADCVRDLIAAGANIEARDYGGRTPLHFAARSSWPDRVRDLIAAGANIEARDYDGQTPLHCAASRGHADCVRRLIAAGSDVNALDDDGNTPLHRAAMTHPTLVEVDGVRLLLEFGADVEARNKDGLKPHYAAQMSKSLTVENLIYAEEKKRFLKKRGLQQLPAAQLIIDSLARMILDEQEDDMVRSEAITAFRLFLSECDDKETINKNAKLINYCMGVE